MITLLISARNIIICVLRLINFFELYSEKNDKILYCDNDSTYIVRINDIARDLARLLRTIREPIQLY